MKLEAPCGNPMDLNLQLRYGRVKPLSLPPPNVVDGEADECELGKLVMNKVGGGYQVSEAIKI